MFIHKERHKMASSWLMWPAKERGRSSVSNQKGSVSHQDADNACNAAMHPDVSSSYLVTSFDVCGVPIVDARDGFPEQIW